MRLNIKNPKTHKLVKRLATELNISQTDAVTLFGGDNFIHTAIHPAPATDLI